MDNHEDPDATSGAAPALYDAAYGIFLGLAVVVPLSGPVIILTMGEAGMMAAIFILVMALPVAVVGCLLSLVCWREWPLLILSTLAVVSTIGLAQGLAGYELTGISFVVASIGFNGWWFARRRRAFVEKSIGADRPAAR